MKQKLNGMFVTFEGPEGSGKTTQARRLEKHLCSQGKKVLYTREPGGTVIGEEIRTILLNPAHTRMESITELLLYLASRAQHLKEIILPAVDAGNVVICDRFTDATIAYQGYGRGLDIGFVEMFCGAATWNVKPDLTIVLDVAVDVGLGRIQKLDLAADTGDRIEEADRAFHERMRRGYLALARKEPERIKVVDVGEQGIDEVWEKILEIVQRTLLL